MSPSDLNASVWHAINTIGWYWWSVPIILSIWSLVQLYRLDEARTKIGRAARVTATIGCLMMLGSPWFNVAGCLAFPLIMFSFAVILTQQANECAAKRRRIVRIHIKPVGAVSNVALRLARATTSPAPVRH